MPGLNQRGPEGQGPMTGNRMGRCTKFGATLQNQNVTSSDQIKDQPENFPGRGLGLGHGRGCRIRGKGRGIGLQSRQRGGF